MEIKKVARMNVINPPSDVYFTPREDPIKEPLKNAEPPKPKKGRPPKNGNTQRPPVGN